MKENMPVWHQEKSVESGHPSLEAFLKQSLMTIVCNPLYHKDVSLAVYADDLNWHTYLYSITYIVILI